jgi:hypothetical protein
MRHVVRHASWRKTQTVSAGQATVLGFAVGCAAAVLCALASPRDFTVNFLLILLVSIGPVSAIFGYIFWLSCEPASHERLQRICTFVAWPAILVVSVASPSIFPDVARTMGPHMVVVFMGFIASLAVLAMGAGLGLAHLVGYLALSVHQSRKRASTSRTGGLWDRDLDEGRWPIH